VRADPHWIHATPAGKSHRFNSLPGSVPGSIPAAPASSSTSWASEHAFLLGDKRTINRRSLWSSEAAGALRARRDQQVARSAVRNTDRAGRGNAAERDPRVRTAEIRESLAVVEQPGLSAAWRTPGRGRSAGPLRPGGTGTRHGEVAQIFGRVETLRRTRQRAHERIGGEGSQGRRPARSSSK